MRITDHDMDKGAKAVEHVDTVVAESPVNRLARKFLHGMRRLGIALCVVAYFIACPLMYSALGIWSLLPTRNPERRARRLRRVVSAAFRSMHVFLRWTHLVDFNPSEHIRYIPDSPCVLVANHPTLMDISALLAADANLVFPVKPDLFNRVWAAPLFRGSGHFRGAGQDFHHVGPMIELAVRRLAAGLRVIIFPEGTRSPDRGLHPFGRAAFEIARRAAVPIVPLVIHCEPRFLGKSSGFAHPPAELPHLYIKVLEKIDPNEPGLAGSSSRNLRDIVVERIRTELDRVEGVSGMNVTVGTGPSAP